MDLTVEQQVMLLVVECFENGRPNLFHQTYWNANTKELSGGLLMASTLSGNLGKLLQEYQGLGGTQISQELIDNVVSKNILNDVEMVKVFKESFSKAGSDPLMREAQRTFFAREFLLPAEKKAATLEVLEPLGRLVVLDSFVQGAFGVVVGKMSPTYPETDQKLNQWDFIRVYLSTRRNWLATHTNKVLNKTVDRVDCLIALEKDNHWDLKLPINLTTKGYTLTEKDLT